MEICFLTNISHMCTEEDKEEGIWWNVRRADTGNMQFVQRI